ncbi:MAG: sulfite exporter TauE/SafE family protein [Bdellovibrionales bacterium]|nr:sulfite exporter TauE/SafE family protein [Bdellovibrionales bacterium]
MGEFNLSITHAFIAGMLTSLTPCVYPLIPITLALFGASEQRSRITSFYLSSVYVLGIAVTYTLLGIASALTGAVFGNFLSNVYVLCSLSVLLFYLYLTTLDLLQLPLMARIQSKAAHLGGKGYVGAFTMGLVSGIVAAPCIGPILAEILLFAAKTQDLLRGASLLFSYALGFGLIFIVLGSFAGAAKHLPKAGRWLYFVKFIIATSILFVVLFLWKPKIPHQVFAPLQVLNPAFLTSLIFIALALSYVMATKERKLGCIILSLLVAYTTFYYSFPPQAPKQFVAFSLDSDAWLPTSAEALELGKAHDRITVIDMYADWCLACKELEDITFADPRIKTLLRSYIRARVDYEQEPDLVSRFDVLGLPTVLFITPDGKEIPNSRVSGFLTPDELIAHLAQAGLTK